MSYSPASTAQNAAAKKIIIVGAGWAGLGAAYHLAKQGYAVTLLEAGAQPGGLVAGWQTPQGRSVEAGIHGFWYPYNNIFALTDELGIQPFTPYTCSSQYSPAGLEVESPIFQREPALPTPLGTFLYTKFRRLPLIDRLSALPLLYALVDFDNSDEAWKRYDNMTARELFKQYGVSERLYKESFEPMLLVGLFAPGEQCSAAAALGMLYYFILAHQPDFDVRWCRGTVGEMIFRPWVEQIEKAGGRILANQRVSDVRVGAGNSIDAVICGDDVFEADAVIFSVGITGMKKIVAQSDGLRNRPEFRDLANLNGIDVLAARLWFDRKIDIPLPSNACFGFHQTTGWTFFDLNALHDQYKNEPGSVIEVDYYHANQLLNLSDQQVLPLVQKDLAGCLPAFGDAKIIDHAVVRIHQGVSHFAPGSYRYLPKGTTSFANVFMAGDWIVTRHGSWSQEKAYVTGLEAANQIITQFGEGELANIIPVIPDEPHIQAARSLNRTVRAFSRQLLPQFWLP
jgi:uncharacterized protein with NAD-binding domain and iron-sulfur cluster